MVNLGAVSNGLKGSLTSLSCAEKDHERTPVMKSQRWGHHARRMEQMDTFNTTVSQITGSGGPNR